MHISAALLVQNVVVQNLC